MRGNDSAAGSFSSAWKVVRGNDSVASVEESVLRRKRDRDLNSVRTSSDRQHLHDYLERNAESAVRGENAAEKFSNSPSRDLSRTRILKIATTSSESMG